MMDKRVTDFVAGRAEREHERRTLQTLLLNLRMKRVPVGSLLVGVSNTEELLFLKV